MAENIVEQSHTPIVVEENVTFDEFTRRYEGQAVEWHGGKIVKKVSNNP